MDGSARDIARVMSECLESYRGATADLLSAVGNLDDEGTGEAVERRDRCILLYRQAIEAWHRLPPQDRDASLLAKTDWHLGCIKEADDDVLKLALSLKEEIGAEISRIGTLRKADRAYQPAGAELMRIVSGEG